MLPDELLPDQQLDLSFLIEGGNRKMILVPLLWLVAELPEDDDDAALGDQ
jgi:hypothetical protein